MKNLKENLATLATYREADAVNAENFAAWTLSDATRLEQLSMTGTLGNSFYADAKEMATEAVKLLERAEPKALAAAIIRGRNEGFIRSFPILGLVYLSQKDSALFQSAFPKVILTGNDLEDFIGLTRTVRGFGRAVKTAMADWIAKNANPYYAQKYRHQIADAIRICRFKGEDSIFAYILGAYSSVKGNSAEKLEKAYADYPALAAHRDFVLALEQGNYDEAEKLLKETDIDVNSLTTYYGQFNQDLWAAVAKKSSVMRFLKYLDKFRREGVLTAELLHEKINVTVLKKAKVFPFRLYTAYRAIGNGTTSCHATAQVNHPIPSLLCSALNALESDSASTPSPTTKKTMLTATIRRHLEMTLNDYAATYDWSAFAPFRWVIAPDISGSMTSPIGGSSSLSYSSVSAMFCGFFIKGIPDVRVLPWTTQVHPYTVSADAPVMEHIRAIEQMVGGGTFMESAVKHMLEQKIKTDFAVFLTDTEEYGRGWLHWWQIYHRFCPDAVAFIVRGDSYTTAPISDKTAAELNVYQVFGWNDTVMDYIKFIVAERKGLV